MSASTSTHFTLPNWDHDDQFPVGEKKLHCSAEGWNGNSMSGYLLDFNPDARSIKLLPTGADRAVVLKFTQIKRLKVDQLPDVDHDFSPSILQDEDTGDTTSGHFSFVIHLKDGALFSGLAHAHQRKSYGLWLFPKKALDDDPFRVFMPKSAITRLEIKSTEGDAELDTEFKALDFDDTVAAELETLDLEQAMKAPSSMVENQEQLLAALENQANLKPVPIGEALMGLGKISHEQLALALQRQKEDKKVPLGQMLVDMKLVTAADLQVAFARKLGYPFIDLKKFPVDVGALRHVSFAMASRLKILPLLELGNSVVVAMLDPLQFKVIEELEFTTQRKVIPVVTTGADLPMTIVRLYRGMGAGDNLPDNDNGHDDHNAQAGAGSGSSGVEAMLLAAELVGDQPVREDEEAQIEQSDNTLVRLINSMITEAYYQGASDIHIEPYPGREKLIIRFRVDGEMRAYLELPASYRNALVARIKIMCDLDISERRKPQDGKINFSKFGPLRIELRVATIPTANGLEDVVLRILSSSKSLPLDALNLSAHNLAQIEGMIDRPYGLFLCVGPTGSGKTTTLHSALQRINTPNRKIWTAEDPVEITQRGLRQIQVNAKIGWTFATALRSLLRADPDVIMVGEIRDAETAEIAVEASLTGHLVLSTLHTNSAAETITRLIDLGVDPFSFADSLLGVLAQRLVRSFCKECVKESPMTTDRLDELVADYQAALPEDHPERDRDTLVNHWQQRLGRQGKLYEYKPVGCDKCGQTGYRGRVAIHELLSTSPEVRRKVQSRGRPDEIQALAMLEGLRTLRQDGIEKVLQGKTSLAEVRSGANA
jgi:type II secretory ATPase GspE/PulE/Tfp pilus assembly ATPase PilB-like protein